MKGRKEDIRERRVRSLKMGAIFLDDIIIITIRMSRLGVNEVCASSCSSSPGSSK